MGSGASTSASPATSPVIQEKPGATQVPVVSAKAIINPPADVQQDVGPKDIMISYSHNDMKLMKKISDALEANGVSVWVDRIGLKAGVDFLRKIGQAIIDSKVFLSIVTEDSVKSKYCRDELALAYVSQKPIFPVGLKPQKELLPVMDVGMRLQLSRFEWYQIRNGDEFEVSIETVIQDIKTEIANTINKEKEEQHEKSEPAPDEKSTSRRPTMKSRNSRYFRPVGIKRNEFWDKHFGRKDVVDWNSMKQVFMKEFDANLKDMFQTNEDKLWLESILKRELAVKGQMTRKSYDDFCVTEMGELEPFWTRVEDYAVESYAIKKVFEMDSSVRVEAISNLEKYKSPAVIEALMDLLDDDEFNVQAVAAISLSKIKTSDKRLKVKIIDRIIKALDCSDRLVRESACLALGHLKATKAVSRLVKLWRNDVISHVREAAGIALKEIGGEEANQAIHMTKVLTEEIKILTLS